MPRDRLRKRVNVSSMDSVSAHTVVEGIEGVDNLDINQLAKAAAVEVGGGGVVGMDKNQMVIVVDNFGQVSTRFPQDCEDMRLIGDASHLDLESPDVVLSIVSTRRGIASDGGDFFWSFLCFEDSCAIDSVLESMTAVYTLMELDHTNRRALLKHCKHQRLLEFFEVVMSAQELQEPTNLNNARDNFRAFADSIRDRGDGMMDNAEEVINLLLQAKDKNSFVPLVGGHLVGSRIHGGASIRVQPDDMLNLDNIRGMEDYEKVYEGFTSYSNKVCNVCSVVENFMKFHMLHIK